VTRKEDRHRVGRRLLKALLEQQHIHQVEPPSRRFVIRTGREIMAQPLPDYQIDGLWPERSLVVLFGSPGTGKSFLALAWALAILNGIPWIGQRCIRGPVLYIAAEGQGFLRIRLEAWQRGNRGHSAAELWVITDPPQLLDPAEIDALIAALKALPERPVLVVIDTLARTMVGGDENSAKDVGLFIGAIDRIRTEFGCTVLVVHHSGKEGSKERGSSALRGAADVMIRVNRLPGKRDVFRVHCEKAKDGPGFKTFTLDLIPTKTTAGESCYLIAGDWRTKGDQVGPNLPEPARKLHETLRTRTKGAADRALTSAELRERSGLKKTSFQRALKTLKEGGFVEFRRMGQKLIYWSLGSDKDQGSPKSERGPPKRA
jgi:hypothetical protein